MLEIAILAVFFYYVIAFFRGTRGAQILMGMTLLLVAMLVLTHFFRLDALNWLLRRLSVYLAAAFLIIFQPEIRRALAELGKQHVFAGSKTERTLVDHIAQAVFQLAERRIGALIAVEREIRTRTIQETGTRLDSLLTPELLSSIFYPNTPLHDGGVVIAGGRIVAAGCLFPLTQRDEISKALGTRHRAAIGITEETDAVAIVVSEETGGVSMAFKGRLVRRLDDARLRRLLSGLLARSAGGRLARAQKQLDLTPEGLAKKEEEAEREFESSLE